MRLWTFQAPAAWAGAQERGVLRADGRRTDRLFRGAYAWLRERMKERIPGCQGGYPVWAWTVRPDLRHREHLYTDAQVLLEVEVPAERVLVSDFMAWHFVLNGWYLALTEAEDERWERRWNRARGERGRALPSSARRVLEASWERIFDVQALDGSPLWRGERVLQAVVEEVRLQEVVDVRETRQARTRG